MNFVLDPESTYEASLQRVQENKRVISNCDNEFAHNLGIYIKTSTFLESYHNPLHAQWHQVL